MNRPARPPLIGVLALQGAFREHRQALERLGVAVSEVRLPRHLDGLHGVIIPGGESTTMAKLMRDYGLDRALESFHRDGGALWGTCAGAIELASDIVGFPEQPRLGLMPMSVVRNDYGRQVASFEADLDIRGLDAPFHALFIRAPRIVAVGEGVEVLARYEGDIVAAAAPQLMATVFHPELLGDDRVHALFVERVCGLPLTAAGLTGEAT
ncbi:MAG TPA: pyridoxal 5'-phosphate synthase glutaminase subunit PdxT [Trueperaceae bacterium]|nr:pyridoxal 5'-phosphate synthase glutaminase subunit PdxT [Trueperaceae bacterium]